MYYSQKFISVINVFRDDDMKDEIKNIKIWSIYKTMLSYCVKCRKNTENKNPKYENTKLKKSNPFIKIWIAQ